MTVSAEQDAAQVDAANATGRPAVVFVHGLWLLSNSWEQWRGVFEEADAVLGMGRKGRSVELLPFPLWPCLFPRGAM